MRRTGSISRQLTDEVIDNLISQTPGAAIRVRDLANPLPYVTEDWINANFTDPDERTESQKQTLAHSDQLMEELETADTIIIGLPIYNFGVPAAVKAWIDLIARARRTFKYTETGPEGLLKGKMAYIVVASGGKGMGTEIDFATDYMKFALGFVGIKNVKVIDASAHMSGLDQTLAHAREAIAA
jgi:FMN-dependent NADH-azoreductase